MYKRLLYLAICLVLGLTGVAQIAHAQVQNLALNHSFEEDEVIQDDPAWEQWATWNPAEGAGSIAYVVDTEAIDGTRSLRVEPVGTENWHFIVLYLPYTVDMSKDYTVSFWAKADAPRPLTVAMKASDNSVAAWGATDFDLTTEWAEHTYTSNVLHTEVKLEFWCAASDVPFYMDFLYIYEGPYVAGIEPSGLQLPVKARVPDPAADETGVPRDVDLSWTPGIFAATHDVYFGTVFDDVNDASRTDPRGVLLSEDQTATTYELPDLLAFGQTCYWRIDEVNGAPDHTIYKGDVWRFTVEQFAYAVEGIIATSNAVSEPGRGPERTVDGSGLDPDDQHSTNQDDMWLATPNAEGPSYIQFEFDRVYKLHEMLVWNFNMVFETFIGIGIRDATIEYSTDGTSWTLLEQVELAQGLGVLSYTANSTIAFDGVPVKYVRLTVNSRWGTAGQMGLSEVRFMHIPVQASKPEPSDGDTDVALDAVLSWRAGRGAVSHKVYLDPEMDAVLDGTALVGTPTETRHNPGGLDLGRTYYWKVDEVNDADTTSVWPGNVWSFSTLEYLVVDDFESYTDDFEAGEAIWQTWIDGWGDASNGAQVGYVVSPFAERAIVHGGSQSMPLSYDNTGQMLSVGERTFGTAQNWAGSGIARLQLWFYGDPATNDPGESMWVRLTDQGGSTGTVVYGEGPTEGPDNQAEAVWHEWFIPLADFGVNLAQVKAIAIGFGGPGSPGSAGMVFIDDIRLYPAEDGQGILVGHWGLDGDATDISGSGNHGTLGGTPSWIPDGVFGGALALDGVEDYVDCGADVSLDITEKVTLSAWVRPLDADNGAHTPYVGKGDTQYAIKKNAANEVEFFIYDGGWNTIVFPVDASFNSQWHHVAASYDGMDLRLYVDGIHRRTLRHIGDIDSTTYPVNIGRNSQVPSRLYQGDIDEARIYSGALSAGAIAELAAR